MTPPMCGISFVHFVLLPVMHPENAAKSGLIAAVFPWSILAQAS